MAAALAASLDLDATMRAQTGPRSRAHGRSVDMEDLSPRKGSSPRTAEAPAPSPERRAAAADGRDMLRVAPEPGGPAAAPSESTVMFVRHGQSRWNVATKRWDVLGMLGERDHGELVS